MTLLRVFSFFFASENFFLVDMPAPPQAQEEGLLQYLLIQ